MKKLPLFRADLDEGGNRRHDDHYDGQGQNQFLGQASRHNA